MRHTRGLAAAPLVLAAAPLDAVWIQTGVADDLPQVIEAASDDVLPSPNVTPVGLLPEPSVISVAFASDAPVMYASTLSGVRTYDISDPTRPQLLGPCRSRCSRPRTSSSANAPTARSSS